MNRFTQTTDAFPVVGGPRPRLPGHAIRTMTKITMTPATKRELVTTALRNGRRDNLNSLNCRNLDVSGDTFFVVLDKTNPAPSGGHDGLPRWEGHELVSYDTIHPGNAEQAAFDRLAWPVFGIFTEVNLFWVRLYYLCGHGFVGNSASIAVFTPLSDEYEPDWSSVDEDDAGDSDYTD